MCEWILYLAHIRYVMRLARRKKRETHTRNVARKSFTTGSTLPTCREDKTTFLLWQTLSPPRPIFSLILFFLLLFSWMARQKCSYYPTNPATFNLPPLSPSNPPSTHHDVVSDARAHAPNLPSFPPFPRTEYPVSDKKWRNKLEKVRAHLAQQPPTHATS